MPRLRGRAKQVVERAQQRVLSAQEMVDSLRAQLNIAEARLQAHQVACQETENQLTIPAPRQPSRPTVKGGGKRGRKAKATVVVNDCGQCDYFADHNIHHLESLVDYHPFVPPAPSAQHPLSPSNGAEGSTASIGTSGDVVGNVVHGSAGGG